MFTQIFGRYTSMVNTKNIYQHQWVPFVQDIKMHRWFQTVDWCAMIGRKVPPPVVPEVRDTGDTSNFDKPRGRLFLASSIDAYGDLFKDF